MTEQAINKTPSSMGKNEGDSPAEGGKSGLFPVLPEQFMYCFKAMT